MKIPRRGLTIIALLATACSLPAGAAPLLRPVADAGLQLNGLMNNGRFSPDGQWLVFRHDPVVSGAYELYSSPRHGGPVVRLSYALAANVPVWNFEVTPDSRRVIYQVAQETVGKNDLWSVPIEGPAGASVRLNPSLGVEDEILAGRASLTPDGSRLVFLASIGGPTAVWSVPVEGPGNAAVKLSPPSSAPVLRYLITQDGSRVVFQGALSTPGKQELWTVPIDGPAHNAVKLTPTPVDSGVNGWRLSPDSSRVVYRGSIDSATLELFSVPIDGPAAARVKLHPTPVAGGLVTGGFDVAPDSSRVVFRGDLLEQGRFELWSVPIEGPGAAAVRLHATPAAGGFVAEGHQLSTSGARVVFRANLSIGALRTELWSAPIDGSSAAIKLHPFPVQGGDVTSFAIAPDDTRVVFVGDIETNGLFELWSTPIEGPGASAVKLSGVQDPGREITDWQISPDSSRVVFRGNLTFASSYWLYSTPIQGGIRTTLTSFMLSSGSAEDGWQITPDSRYVIYRSNFAVESRTDLARVSIEGPPRQLLSPAMADDRGVRKFFYISPDSRAVFYWVDVDLRLAWEGWIADDSVFLDGFEWGDATRWSSVVP